MPFEAVKCPQCGANVEVEAKTATFFCTYCGTRLQASRSSMGVLSASILSGIKDDTSIMAKRAALEHLNQHLMQLEEQRITQKETLQTEYSIKMGELYKKASAKAGFFGDPLKSEYYINGEVALRNNALRIIRDLDTKIGEIKRRISTLEDELNSLVMHV